MPCCPVSPEARNDADTISASFDRMTNAGYNDPSKYAVQPTLKVLSVLPNAAKAGVPFVGLTLGKTVGSTLVLSGAGSAGLVVNQTTGDITGTPTAVGAVNITESYAFSPNSPKVNNGVITVTALAAMNSVSLGGDSLMFNGNPGSGSAIGGASTSHVDWANDKARQVGLGLDALFLRAAGGTTIQQFVSAQLPNILTDATAGAWVHTGANSFNDGITTPLGGPYTLQKNIDDLKAAITTLAAGKTFVIIDALQPVSQAGITGAKPRWAEFPAFNAAIKAHCDTFQNVIFNDVFTPLVDPASPVNNPLPNLLRTDDGIHYTTNGAKVAGYASFANIWPRLALIQWKAQNANLAKPFDGSSGGVSTPGGGTITGNVPTGYTLQIVSGAAAAVVTSTPVAGKLRLAVTAPANSVIYLFTNNPEIFAAASLNAYIQAGFDFEVVSQTNLTRIAGTIRKDGASSYSHMYRDTVSEPDAVAKFPTGAYNGRRWSKPFKLASVPATTLDYVIAIGVAAGGSAVIDLSLPTVVKMP